MNDWELTSKVERLVAILAIEHDQTRQSRLLKLCDEWGVIPAVAPLSDIAGDVYHNLLLQDYERTVQRLAQHAAKEITNE